MLAIGQVAEATGLTNSAIRYYESVGLIPETTRLGGKRRYSQEIIQRLNTIILAQQAGFQVLEIHTLLEGFDSNIPPSERWRALAEVKKIELDEKKRQITRMKKVLDIGLNCDCLSWDECFKNKNMK